MLSRSLGSGYRNTEALGQKALNQGHSLGLGWIEEIARPRFISEARKLFLVANAQPRILCFYEAAPKRGSCSGQQITYLLAPAFMRPR